MLGTDRQLGLVLILVFSHDTSWVADIVHTTLLTWALPELLIELNGWSLQNSMETNGSNKWISFVWISLLLSLFFFVCWFKLTKSGLILLPFRLMCINENHSKIPLGDYKGLGSNRVISAAAAKSQPMFKNAVTHKNTQHAERPHAALDTWQSPFSPPSIPIFIYTCWATDWLLVGGAGSEGSHRGMLKEKPGIEPSSVIDLEMRG